MVDRYDVPMREQIAVSISEKIRNFQRGLSNLPSRWQWTVHNIVAHPLSEVAFQVGALNLSDIIHDCTIPIRHDVDFLHPSRTEYEEIK